MTTKELRIGNIVMHNGIVCEVEQILFNDWIEISGKDYWFPCPIEEIEPIPITEQWLTDLGFEENPYQDRYEKSKIDIECDKTKGETRLWLSGSEHIKHIHQLQNLFFALTNQELKKRQ